MNVRRAIGILGVMAVLGGCTSSKNAGASHHAGKTTTTTATPTTTTDPTPSKVAPTTVPTLTINGTLFEIDYEIPAIGIGSYVTVTDQSGKVIGTTSLGAGVAGNGDPGSFKFTAPNLPIERSYGIQIAQENVVVYSLAQVEYSPHSLTGGITMAVSSGTPAIVATS